MGNPYEVIVSLPAQRDVLEIIEYYESVRIGLGDEFLLSFDETLNFLSTHPNIYEKVYDQEEKEFQQIKKHNPIGFKATQENEI